MDKAVSQSTSLLNCSTEIQAELRTLMTARTAQATAYGLHFSNLWKHASDCIADGKLLRPRLLLATYDALTSDPGKPDVFRDSAVRVAASVEMLHYSFLLHDDVIDRDLFRRGRLNLIGQILNDLDPAKLQAALNAPLTLDSNELHWAHTNAILMGDLMLSATHQVFAREDLPTDVRLRLLDLLDHTVTESVAGEQLDVGLSKGLVSSDLNAVLGMSRLKTATYTFELPLKAAAILAGTSSRVQDTIGEIGKHLGLAFQLQDDLLSTFGDANEHGKDPFSDLREGKETTLIAYARMSSDWPSIEPHFGRHDLSDEDCLHVRNLLAECGAEQFVRSLIEEQIRACFDLISSTERHFPSQLRQLFGQLVDSIVERRS